MKTGLKKCMKENRNKSWKTALKYGFGILILAFSVAAAMYVPQWYGAWQDSQLLGQVQLSSRKNVSFIDTASLDNAGRLQLLAQTKEIRVETYEGYSSRVLQNPQDFLKACIDQAETFGKAGLLPEFYVDLVTEDNCEVVSSPLLILDESRILQVNFVLFRKWGSPAERLIMIMDAETDFVYYISFSGMKAADEVLRRFDIDSWGGLEYAAEIGRNLQIQTDILEAWNITDICGAEAEIHPYENFGYTEVDLTYENFQTKAYQYLIIGDAPGFAFMFGTEDWNSLVNQELSTYGYAVEEMILDYDRYAKEREEILEKEFKENQEFDKESAAD